MAKAAPIPGLTGDEPYASAAAMVITVRARELREHASGVLDTSDIERVHDMRVATRRLRAALEVFAPCFPAHAHKEVLREVKRLADALGERRDRDVTIAALEGFTERLSAPDRPGIASLVAKLRDEQAAANDALATFVGPERLAALDAGLSALAAAARQPEAQAAPDRDGSGPIGRPESEPGQEPDVTVDSGAGEAGHAPAAPEPAAVAEAAPEETDAGSEVTIERIAESTGNGSGP